MWRGHCLHYNRPKMQQKQESKNCHISEGSYVLLFQVFVLLLPVRPSTVIFLYVLGLVIETSLGAEDLNLNEFFLSFSSFVCLVHIVFTCDSWPVVISLFWNGKHPLGLLPADFTTKQTHHSQLFLLNVVTFWAASCAGMQQQTFMHAFERTKHKVPWTDGLKRGQALNDYDGPTSLWCIKVTPNTT